MGYEDRPAGRKDNGMISLISVASDRALAEQLAAELRAAGHTVVDAIQPGREPIVVALLSPDALRDRAFVAALDAANDFGQNMVTVLARPVELPKNFDHLKPLDFTSGASVADLLAQVSSLGSEAPYAVRMQTGKVRAANRRALLFFGVLVIGLFVIGSIMIILFDIESPAAEYAAVDTQVALTRDAIIGPTMAYLSTVLPRSTEAAEAFPETLEPLPTVLRPLLALTATAISEQLAGFEATPEAGE